MPRGPACGAGAEWPCGRRKRAVRPALISVPGNLHRSQQNATIFLDRLTGVSVELCDRRCRNQAGGGVGAGGFWKLCAAASAVGKDFTTESMWVILKVSKTFFCGAASTRFPPAFLALL
jgi:hypothetical protein